MPVQTSPLAIRPAPADRCPARLASVVATVALLSACATQPQISAQQESHRYRAHAGHTYTPPGPASDPWGPYVSEASAKFDVPERWVREVMRQESGGRLYGRSGDLVTSGAGAMGLMQVMPATYDEIRGRYPELGNDPYDPHNNIMAGTAYIREMYDIYGSPGFLAAYNAGPGRLDDYLTRNRTLPEETRRYVAAIGPRIAGSQPRTASPGQQYAMNAMPFSIPDGPRYASSRYSAPTDGPVLAPQEPIRLAAVPASRGPAIVLSPQPIEVAQAPEPRGPAIVLHPQPIEVAQAPEPRGPAIVLHPQPIEVAEAPEPREPGIVLRPQPIETAALPEPPRPSFTPAPSPVIAPPRAFASAPAFASTPVYVPAPVYTPAPSRSQYAQLPEPPRYFAPPPARETGRTQQALAAASLVPVTPRGSSFPFISAANAEPVGMRRAGYTPGHWAVQVGAFANEGLAASATSTARDHARDLLSVARTNVTAIREPHGVLYRARLTGLSRDAAGQACERLSHARTTCMVVSPDAQS